MPAVRPVAPATRRWAARGSPGRACTSAGPNFAFCDGSVHFLRTGIPTDPTQATCNKPVAANFTYFNLYFANDGNPVNGSDY